MTDSKPSILHVDVRTGGLNSTRRPDLKDPFERAAAAAFGGLVRASTSFGEDLWRALSNVYWRHDDHAAVGYTFRAAGDLVAALKGEGTYMDWYWAGNPGRVSTQIKETLAAAGWTPSDRGVAE